MVQFLQRPNPELIMNQTLEKWNSAFNTLRHVVKLAPSSKIERNWIVKHSIRPTMEMVWSNVVAGTAQNHLTVTMHCCTMPSITTEKALKTLSIVICARKHPVVSRCFGSTWMQCILDWKLPNVRFQCVPSLLWQRVNCKHTQIECTPRHFRSNVQSVPESFITNPIWAATLHTSMAGESHISAICASSNTHRNPRFNDIWIHVTLATFVISVRSGDERRSSLWSIVPYCTQTVCTPRKSHSNAQNVRKHSIEDNCWPNTWRTSTQKESGTITTCAKCQCIADTLCNCTWMWRTQVKIYLNAHFVRKDCRKKMVCNDTWMESELCAAE